VEVLILLIAVLVVAGAVAAFVASRRGPGVAEPPAPRDAEPAVVEEGAPVEVEGLPEAPPLERPRFRDRLTKARGTFAGFLGRSTVDEATFEELEDALILADVGTGLSGEILENLRARVKDEAITDAGGLRDALGDELRARLAGDRSLRLDDGTTNVWLFVGVNGVGKTTTIGKVGRRLADDGHRVVMAAGDTFRAAAAEQLGTWAERAGAQFVRGGEGADPSSVIFDAVESATSRGADVVLADTAGRLHTKSNLMDELAKVRRVAEKGSGVVTEVLLVLDATTGQNGLVQAREFTGAVEVTGVVLTKLDGSAKGGIVLAIQHELGIPVKLVGLGETVEDLVDFEPDEFVEALLA
jgi:fused signal recognition particle receptor